MKKRYMHSTSRFLPLCFACVCLPLSVLNSHAQIAVDDEGNVRIGDLSVSADGDVEMPGLTTDSEGNVALGDISVSADGSVVLPALRVESNGSVSIGSRFDADMLSDAIDDQGDSANVIVLFESGSAVLTSEGRSQVEEIADAIMYLGSSVRIEIQGHTDSVGTEADNTALSKARAQSVADELKAEHMVDIPLTTIGFGESQPIADNNSDTGRALNRRVTIKNLGSE